MPGPLDGLKVIELAGLGPAPFCGMVLADLGAEVIRIERPNAPSVPGALARGRRSVAIDLKHPGGASVVLRLAEEADALIEGFRPGVVERLGVGPDECLARNPRLVYGRMTGWGQEGPCALDAGHDIDYIAVSGVLHAIGDENRPVPPLNLVGDFGGGGMLLAVGVLAGVWEATRSGQGQVIDAAMVDGSALLATMMYEMLGSGLWDPTARHANPLDGGAPWYTTYATSDNRHMAVGAIEPQFYAELLTALDLDDRGLPAQHDRSGWPTLRAAIAQRFSECTQEHWTAHFAGTDACVAPVVSFAEAPDHPHNRARNTFVDVAGVPQPGPAPRFSRTVSQEPQPAPAIGRDTRQVLAEAGFPTAVIDDLFEQGAVA